VVPKVSHAMSTLSSRLKGCYTGHYSRASSKPSSRTPHKHQMRLLLTKECAMLMHMQLGKLRYRRHRPLRGAFQDPRIAVLSVMRACMTFLRKYWYSVKTAEMRYIRNASNNVRRFCCMFFLLASMLTEPWLARRASKRCATYLRVVSSQVASRRQE
jgi:hypothetical protein